VKNLESVMKIANVTKHELTEKESMKR